MKYGYWCLAATLALAACSEAADPDNSSSSSTTTSASGGNGAGGMGSGGDSTSSSSAGGGGVGGSINIDGLVINEISADNDDWIELYNTTSNPISLDGVRVADNDGGVPKVAEAADLTGVVVPGGGHYFILADVNGPAAGEVADCSPWPSPCVETEYGISHGNGDTIYLLDSADNILMQADYPAEAVVEDMSQTWCRLPDGTGDFAACNATAGASNEAAP